MALVIALAMVLGMMSLSAFAEMRYTKCSSTDTFDPSASYYFLQGEDYVPATFDDQQQFTNACAQGDNVYIGVDDSVEPGDPTPEQTGHTISLNSDDTHTYRVFQVLTGTLAAEGETALGNPAWGADAIANPGGVDAFIEAITADGLSEREIAALVAAKVDTSSDGQGTVDKDNPLTGLATGYYVLVDETELEDGEELSLNVVKVVNDIEGFTVKYDTVTDEKEIVSDTLGQDGDEVNEIGGDSDNVSIGDTVNYQITAKIPATADDNYNYYYFVINDTLSDGLTFTEGSIKVYKESVADANLLREEEDYLVRYGDDCDGHTFEVGMIDAMSLAGKNIIVTYSAVLNENAEIGEDGNYNTSTVTYSNNPNHEYDGGETPGDNPGFPDETDLQATGETPVTDTWTFTTGIEIQKVDQDGKPLEGAAFTLSGTTTKIVLTVAEEFEEDDAGDYYKLKNGKYTKEPPTEGDTMQPAEEGATAGYVIDNEATGDDVIEYDNNKYRPYVPETDEGKDIFVKVNGNADQYEEGKYSKTVTKTKNEVQETHTVTAEVDENGLVRFDGIGAGEYVISETTTPSGYNTLADLTVTATFDDEADPKDAEEIKWSFSGGNGTYDAEEGIYKIEIENNKGTELPETGGIGTTIFYVVGALLVLGAGVVLITRRRMDA